MQAALIVLMGGVCCVAAWMAATHDKEIQRYYLSLGELSKKGKEAAKRCREKEEERIRRELGM